MSRMSDRARRPNQTEAIDARVAAAALAITGAGLPDPFTHLVDRFRSGYTALGLDPVDEVERVTSKAVVA